MGNLADYFIETL